jgi:uncharacterized membrane protein YeaQ/YmgE (transglycosylase-associated protein family)
MGIALNHTGRMVMTIEALIIWLVIGAIAGWLAGQIMEGYGFGLIGNIVVGIVGALIAGWLLPQLGFVLIGGIGAAIINAVIGAVVLLAVIGLFKKRRDPGTSLPQRLIGTGSQSEVKRCFRAANPVSRWRPFLFVPISPPCCLAA